MSLNKEILASVAVNRMGTGVSAWEAMGVRWYPKRTKLFEDRDFILDEIFGSEPNPIFSLSDPVLTFGSCFASRLNMALKNKGCKVDYIDVPSGLNNTFALRHYIEWLVTGSNDGYDYGERPPVLKDIKLVVITFGLAEVWKDKDEKVLWRGVREDAFDKGDHCVLSTVEENLENIRRIHELLPCKKVFTLSPIPLNATFRNQSCIVADCASKAVLRVALDLFHTEHPEVIYFPSYEFIKSVPPHNGFITLKDGDFSRGIEYPLSKLIVERFLHLYAERQDALHKEAV